MTFDREAVKEHLSTLSELGIYFGTSSWKYPGWCDQLYESDRYRYRSKFSESRFNRLCLEEYAEVFKTVSVDAAYYTFPSEKYLAGLIGQVPGDFKFALKVTDEITVKHFPNLNRFGNRAGKGNENFLNAALFEEAFLGPCETCRDSIGLIMFEFSRFYPRDFQRGREFVEALDRFLGQLPKGWPYGVEIRNKNLLVPEYFRMLSRHGVTHVYNNWSAMPPVADQVDLAAEELTSELTAARFLLRPGRKYQEAVDLFSPYQKVRDPNPEARTAGAHFIRQALQKKRGKTFVYVNNRLEGNALVTVQEMLKEAAKFRH